MAQRGYRTIKIDLPRKGTEVAVYASAKVADALREITSNATLYMGVRLTQVMEAVYEQGKKDGAREVFDTLDKSMAGVKKEIPHRAPGRPRKK